MELIIEDGFEGLGETVRTLINEAIAVERGKAGVAAMARAAAASASTPDFRFERRLASHVLGPAPGCGRVGALGGAAGRCQWLPGEGDQVAARRADACRTAGSRQQFYPNALERGPALGARARAGDIGGGSGRDAIGRVERANQPIECTSNPWQAAQKPLNYRPTWDAECCRAGHVVNTAHYA
jgi:hypothetical protein